MIQPILYNWFETHYLLKNKGRTLSVYWVNTIDCPKSIPHIKISSQCSTEKNSIP